MPESQWLPLKLKLGLLRLALPPQTSTSMWSAWRPPGPCQGAPAIGSQVPTHRPSRISQNAASTLPRASATPSARGAHQRQLTEVAQAHARESGGRRRKDLLSKSSARGRYDSHVSALLERSDASLTSTPNAIG
jgi:hypothetical protein